jgi:hypothetical protein
MKIFVESFHAWVHGHATRTASGYVIYKLHVARVNA